MAAWNWPGNAGCIPSRTHFGWTILRLKKRLGEPSKHRRKAPRPVFVELITSHSATREECVIEFESSSEAKMRIRWKALAPPDCAACCAPGGTP
jgi:hypothetical protein